MIDWAEISWPEHEVPRALAALARAAGLCPRDGPHGASVEAAPPRDEPEREAWVERLAQALGFEAEPISAPYESLRATLAALGPGLVRLDAPAEGRYLAVLGRGRVLTPSLETAKIDVAALFDNRALALEAAPGQRVATWLEAARIPARRRARSRQALLGHLLAGRSVGGLWMLRADPGSSFLRELRRRAVFRRLAAFVAATCVAAAMSAMSWYVVGRGALNGVLEPAWLGAWVLLSVGSVPFLTAATHASTTATLEFGVALKQRLLSGALRLDPGVIRAQGSGGLLALVAESEAIEASGATGALGVVTALVQLVSAGFVLAMGVGGFLHVALLLVWAAALVAFAVPLTRRREAWTARRMGLTNGFVENVLGHRTRAVQQRATLWHRAEDTDLEAYAHASARMDSAQAALGSASSRLWLAVALIGLVPPMMAGVASPAGLAVSLGGILLAQSAFSAVVGSATALLAAVVSWRTLAPLFHAATRREPTGIVEAPPLDAADPERAREPALLSMRAVSFEYAPRQPPVLVDCALALRRGDRVLLEGSSGSGKSTLAGVLGAVLSPSHGVVLWRGLDLPTVGAAAWRRRITRAPQFHENHVFPSTLLFNLLMGRRWPPEPDDRRDAEQLCRELGLGPLLARMPLGLDQAVGETGWQLSHGERSRIFLARALLQRPDVLILDETLGAVDPLTLAECVDVVLARVETVLVIAHT